MPVGSKLSSLILSSDDCHFVDSFVAMALSKDGESVEVKYIIKKVTQKAFTLLVMRRQCYKNFRV